MSAIAVPAMAVGLGPMKREGVTVSEKKGFYLTVINPYPQTKQFRIVAREMETEVPLDNVEILPATGAIGGNTNRRVLVVFKNLEVGEVRQARVCARLDRPVQGVGIDARVCSKLQARRLAGVTDDLSTGGGE